jgi:hypothetical protein
MRNAALALADAAGRGVPGEALTAPFGACVIRGIFEAFPFLRVLGGRFVNDYPSEPIQGSKFTDVLVHSGARTFTGYSP